MIRDYEFCCDECEKKLDFWEVYRCSVCEKIFCSDCFNGEVTELEDFAFKHICKDCLTPEIEKLIKKAQKTQERLERAEDEHHAACNKLFDCIVKNKRNYNGR